MFTFVLIYGMHVMRGVIEEKSNRIVEVVLSTGVQASCWRKNRGHWLGGVDKSSAGRC